MSHIIIGTAGHIDHGKTSLVKALTGVDADRLKEEKERGLTIDLGFAFWGDRATIIDVPGHEKFIRNMVAGVSTIDFVLFVVAADDGVMPQTREHLDILKILQVAHGIVVITKIDLVEKDWVDLVRDDVRTLVQDSFLQSASIVPVSSTTLEGIDELKQKMETAWSDVRHKQDKGVFWMPIDRAFSMKGFGTVVTGSVLSGTAKPGESLEVLPQRREVKIRGLQSHGKSVESVSTGDRAAVNIQAVTKEFFHRGDVLAEPSYFQPSKRFDARLDLLQSAPKSLRSGSRVRLHVGTCEIMGRMSVLGQSKVEPGTTAYVQFHLERQATARRLDCFVIRQYSPTITIGGGLILDANAHRHKKSDPKVVEHLKTLEAENPQEVLEGQLLNAEFSVSTIDELAANLATSREDVLEHVNGLEHQRKAILFKKEGVVAVVHRSNFQRLRDLIQEELAEYHRQNPISIGVRKTDLLKARARVDSALLEHALETLKSDDIMADSDGLLHLKSHKPTLTAEQEALRDRIDSVLYDEAFSTSTVNEIAESFGAAPEEVDEIVKMMSGQSQVVRLENTLLFHARRIDEAKQKVVKHLKAHGEISVGQFKDLIGGTSRKFALPILIYFDGLGITERDGDVRVLGDRDEI